MNLDSERLSAARYVCGEESSDCAELAPKFTIMPFPRDAVLFAVGSTCGGLYIVLAGALRLVRKDANTMRLAGMLTHGDEYGSSILFDGGAHPATGIAHTDVRVALLDKTDVFREIETNPRAARHMMRLLERHVDTTDARLHDLVTVDVGGRVARTMLELASKVGVPDGTSVHVAHNLTQQEFAHLVGASRETVNKCLSDFTARGWLRPDRRSVTIFDAACLAQRSCGVPRRNQCRRARPGGLSTTCSSTAQYAL